MCEIFIRLVIAPSNSNEEVVNQTGGSGDCPEVLSSVSINVRRAIPTDSSATGSVFSIVNEQTRAELSCWELVFVNRII